MVDTPRRDSRRRGEPWAAGSVLGYASANIFDRLGVIHADPLIGPFLRGLPSLLLGVFLVWKHHTLDQMRPASSRYIGRRAVLSFLCAGIVSTLGLFLYYFAIRVGGVTVTIPVQETYVIWGTLIAWVFLGERIPRYAVFGVLLIFVGLVTLSWGQSRDIPHRRFGIGRSPSLSPQLSPTGFPESYGVTVSFEAPTNRRRSSCSLPRASWLGWWD